MLPQVKTVLAITPISVTVGSTAVGEFIDTKDWDYVNISVCATTVGVVSNTISSLIIEEGDTTSSVATFTGAVSGTDYTVATNCYTATGATAQNIWTFGVDTRYRKRYLRVSAAPRTTMIFGGTAVLSRGTKAPGTAAEAGALNAIFV